jgi:hypothetical protein
VAVEYVRRCFSVYEFFASGEPAAPTWGSAAPARGA